MWVVDVKFHFSILVCTFLLVRFTFLGVTGCALDFLLSPGLSLDYVSFLIFSSSLVFPSSKSISDATGKYYIMDAKYEVGECMVNVLFQVCICIVV